MKLFVILICLLSERYLIHSVSNYRFYWFDAYFKKIAALTPHKTEAQSFLTLSFIILPLLLITGLVLFFMGHWIFGFVGLILHIIIVYYCIGPENPFYPIASNSEEIPVDNQEAAEYFYRVNYQLFAVILWYVLLGPLGVLLYRLLTLAIPYAETQPAASIIVNLLDWVSARITTMLYLLVGNFQKGIHFYLQQFISSPENNRQLLMEAGILAVKEQEEEKINLTQAQLLVDHALIVFLVFIALFTMVAWL